MRRFDRVLAVPFRLAALCTRACRDASEGLNCGGYVCRTLLRGRSRVVNDIYW